jgi:hypothetical protein
VHGCVHPTTGCTIRELQTSAVFLGDPSNAALQCATRTGPSGASAGAIGASRAAHSIG